MANSRQNHIAKMEITKERRLAAGLLSERYPMVSGIVVNMTYYQKGENPILMLRTVNYSPGGHAYLNMDCVIRECVDGGFDLTPIVSSMVKNRKKSGKGRLVCCGKNSDLSPDHASISYEVTIQYNKKS